MVLVDTSVWSQAFRRRLKDLSRDEYFILKEWTRLVKSGEGLLMGPIRQEILSGIRNPQTFQAIQKELSNFPFVHTLLGDYDRAAMFYNTCRMHGITGSATDFLICAIAYRCHAPIFTKDVDFIRYAHHVPVRLFKYKQ